MATDEDVQCFKKFIQTVGRGERRSKPLSFEDARLAMSLILDGRTDPDQRGAFLLACRIKGESPDEMAGFAAAQQDRCVTLEKFLRSDMCATGGLSISAPVGQSCNRTGGQATSGTQARMLHAVTIGHPYDGREDTFMMGAGAARLAAACGSTVVLHGAGRVPSKCAVGNADVLNALDIPAHLAPDEAGLFLQKHRFVHVDTRTFFPAWNAQLPIREKMGLRLPFSSSEKLLDFAGARRVIVGIAHGPYLEKMTGAMRKLGLNGAVIQGLEGSADLSPQHPTRVCRVEGDKVEEFAVDPKELGLSPVLNVRAVGADPVQNAELTKRVFSNATDEESRAAAEAIALNAAVILWITGIVSDVKEGLALARKTLAEGDFLLNSHRT